MSLKEEMVPIKKQSLVGFPASIVRWSEAGGLSAPQTTSVHVFALNSIPILELTQRDKPNEGLSEEIHRSP